MKSNTLLNCQSILFESDQPFWKKVDKNIKLDEFTNEELCYYSNKEKEYKKKTFSRKGSIIVKFGNGEDDIKYCNVSNSILEQINHQEFGYGIKFIQNTHYFELFGQIEQWNQELKKYCIQTNLKQKYTIGRKLGTGSFADVYLLIHNESKQEFAVKIFDKTSTKFDLTCVKQELDILRQMDHPNTSQIIETYESSKYLYIVQEFYNCLLLIKYQLNYHLYKYGSLYDYLQKTDIPEDDAIKTAYILKISTIFTINCQKHQLVFIQKEFYIEISNLKTFYFVNLILRMLLSQILDQLFITMTMGRYTWQYCSRNSQGLEL